jgi:type I restriction enzyme S subunit
MNETLEAMARAIFKDWFIDFGPTRAKMEGRAPYLAPDIWSIFPDRLDDDGKPEGWNEAPLTHFFEIVGGGTPKTSEPDYWGGDIPWFSVVDTPNGSDTFVFETEKSITDSGLENSSARLLDTGQTIISARGTVGNLAMAGRSMAFNQSCYGLKGINGYGQVFVFLAAKHMVSKLQSLAHGSVFSTITRQTFDSARLNAPGCAVAQQFELATSAIFGRIRANVIETRTLAATRDLLLPKLMSGDVRVEDAETFVGDAT